MMCAAHLHVATNSGGAEVTFDTEQQTDIIYTIPHHSVDGYLLKNKSVYVRLSLTVTLRHTEELHLKLVLLVCDNRCF